MATSLYIDSWKFDKIDSYVKGAKEVTPKKKLKYVGLPEGAEILSMPQGQSKESISTPAKPDVFDEVYPESNVQFPKSTPYDVIKRTLNKDFPSSNSGEYIVWDQVQNTNIQIRYDDKGNKLFTGFPWNIDFKNRVAFFLFLAYPAYLLIRFIVWASLTVRNKK